MRNGVTPAEDAPRVFTNLAGPIRARLNVEGTFLKERCLVEASLIWAVTKGNRAFKPLLDQIPLSSLH
jgi:hypothetical protein